MSRARVCVCVCVCVLGAGAWPTRRSGGCLKSPMLSPLGCGHPGSGMVLVQPHYGIEEELEALLPALGECLRRPGAEAAQARLHWITDA